MHHCFSILGDVTLTSAVTTLIETLLCMFGGHNFIKLFRNTFMKLCPPNMHSKVLCMFGGHNFIKLFSKQFYEIMPSKHAQ